MADPRNPSGASPTKRGYFAAGLGRSAVEARIVDAERARAGTSAHPWPDKLKRDMVEACNGALSQAAIDQTIDRMRIAHEDKVRAGEKALRARKVR